MNSCILDSSVLIAVARQEHYSPGLLTAINGARMSAVNFAEVLTRLADLGIDPSSPPVQSVFSLLSAIEPFTEAQARLTAELRA